MTEVTTTREDFLGDRQERTFSDVVSDPESRFQTVLDFFSNTGGLAFWFLRAERYARREGTPFLSVKDRAQRLFASSLRRSSTQGEAMM